MANVKFLKGTQSALNTLMNGTGDRFTNGAFYLTSDTDRLYVAQSASELVLLNSIVKHVATLGDLPTFADAEPGDFYYVRSGNILVTKVSGGTQWTQINPDTNNRIVNTTSATAVADVTDGVSITTTVTDDGTGSAARSASGSFTIKEGTNVDITRSGNEITINAGNTTYDLSASNNKLTLTPAGGTADEVSLSGTGMATLTASSDTITVNVPKPSITLTKSFDSSGVLTTTVTDSNNATQSSGNTNTITPKIKLDAGATADANGEYKFVSGTATLPVYTKAEVDAAITNAGSAMNAMTYKGTINASGAVSAFSSTVPATAHIGDTYKASTAISQTGLMASAAKIGDLIIAKGNAAGTAIESWEVVPSGDDYVLSSTVSGTSVTVNESATTVLAGITVNGGNHIDATGSVNGKTNTITIDQAADYTAQTASGSSSNVTHSRATGTTNPSTATFTAVTGIQTDAYGNVVDGSIKTASITVTDSHANINAVTPSVSVSNNTASISYTVGDSDNKSASGTFTLDTTGSIAITGSGTNVNIDLVWGTF